MKKLLVILTGTLVCTGAFGQGKLALVNGPQQLIYMTSDASGMLPADRPKSVGGISLAGSSLYTGAGGTAASLAGTPTFTVQLFAGATANSLSPVASGALGTSALGGFIDPAVNVTFATLPAGTPAFFRIDVYDSRTTSAAKAWTTVNPADAGWSMYGGTSPVFSAVPQASVYSPIWTAVAPVSSTMPLGTYVPKDYIGFGSYAGLISVAAVPIPEPGTFALAGLGLATLLAFRRRS